MPRTNSTAVAAIVEVDVGDDLTPFIEVANNLVTNQLGTFTAYLTDTVTLELVERWLSAHFYKMLRSTVGAEHAGPVGQNFALSIGKNLSQTVYGQQAMAIDYSGILANWNMRVDKGFKRLLGGVISLGNPKDATLSDGTTLDAYEKANPTKLP